MGKGNNVTTFYLVPRYQKFNLFCQKAKIDYANSMEHPLTVEDTQVVSNDEGGDEDADFTPVPKPRQSLWSRLTSLSQQIVGLDSQKEDEDHPITTTFNLDGPSTGTKHVVIEEEEDRQPTMVSQQLL